MAVIILLMSDRNGLTSNLSRGLVSIFLAAELFALVELAMAPATYALFRFRESANLLSEMGLLLHSLNSSSTWNNLVVFAMSAAIIFLLISISRIGLKKNPPPALPFALLLGFSGLVFALQAAHSPANSERKIIFYLLLAFGFALWLAISVRLRKRAGSGFLILFSAAVFALANLARAMLILYKIKPGPLALALITLSTLVLLLAAAGLGLFLDRSQSPLLRWAKRGLAAVLLAFGIFILVLPALSWRNLYFSSNAKPGRPNLVMIVMDTVRSDHLSLYGYSRETTPFLDSIAGKALVFDNAFATSPWTLSSHASFFTGLLPSEHNCTYENLRLDPKYPTLATTLEREGYFTIGWSNNPLLNHSSGLTRGFDRFVENNQLVLYTGDWLSQTLRHRSAESRGDNGAALTNHALMRWLPRLSRGRKPFFLFLNYMEAHTPYPRNLMAHKFFTEPKPAMANYPSPSWDVFNCAREQDQRAKNISAKWYDGSIYYLDDQIRQLFDLLSANGLLQNSIVVVLSDHGESFGEHDWWGHGVNLYDTEIKVPLLIYYPKGLAPERIAQDYSLKEVPGLLLQILQENNAADLDRQLQKSGPVFAEEFRPIMYLERMKAACPETDFSRLDRRQKAIIKGPYKLIWDSRGIEELYNLEQDPAETRNLSKTEPQTFSDLSRELGSFISNHPFARGRGKMDTQTVNALKALGYLK